MFECISIVEFVLYLLLFLTQGHPTWESIVDTLTMKTVSSLGLLLQGLSNRFMVEKRKGVVTPKKTQKCIGNASQCRKA